MKKITLIILILAMSLAIVACGQKEQKTEPETSTTTTTTTSAKETSTSTTTTTTTTTEAKVEGFFLEYPDFMKESHGEGVKLDQEPNKVIALSFPAVQVYARTEKRPIAVGKKFMAVKYPEWAESLPQIAAGMRELDIEQIVSLEPDLLIMGAHLKEKYSEQLASAGIPVYYTSEGPITTFDETKEIVLSIAKAVGGKKVYDEILSEYTTVEKRAAELKKKHEAKKSMVFFAVPPKFQQSSEAYFGSMLTKLPFEIITDKLVGKEKRISPFDYEVVITEQPEFIFCLSPSVPTAEMMKEKYEEVFAENPDVWAQIKAKTDDKMIYLSNEFVTTKGLQSVESLNKLIDMLEGLLK